MKKTVSFILAVLLSLATLTFSSVGVSSVKITFADVPSDRWSYDDIAYVCEKGLMKGVADGVFAPDGITTRAMFVTVLWRMENSPAPGTAAGFDDVESGSWYADAVAWAKENGIVKGVSDDRFAPFGEITREQLVTMLYRYSIVKFYDVSDLADLSVFSDEDLISEYAITSLRWAVAAGLVNGVGNGELSPKGNATREQFAALVSRYDKLSLEVTMFFKGEKDDLEYVIKYPEGYRHGEERPLLLFLHGSGTVGTGTEGIMGNEFFSESAKVEDFPFIVLAPVLEDGNWTGVMRTVYDILTELIATDDVDASRVYIMGTSLGGEGTWFMTYRYADLFAASVPICGWGSTRWAAKLATVPIWAFHGELDDAVPYEKSVEMVEAVKAAGGDANLTTFYGVGHGIWNYVYSDPAVYEWMLGCCKP